MLVGTSGPGLLAAALRREPRRWTVVTDIHVRGALWARTERVLRRHRLEVGSPVLLPAGERAKTLRTLERLLEQLLRRGLDRSSGLVALGGGAVTDLAGFAAATYMRGIDWVAVPTTLLGMVDAGLGGKVAANLLRTKNAIGAFHQPRAVLVGTDFLHTLPERERRSGLGEMVKYAMIADRALFRLLERSDPQRLGLEPRADARLVARCCRIKARFVAADPWERGQRRSLNFGHTVGHALEAAAAGRLTHGEAVGLGMLVATAVAEATGVAQEPMHDRLEALLERLGLPTRAPWEPSLPRLRRSLGRDKKAHSGRLHFVLTPRIGACSLGHVVGDEVLAQALARIAPSRRRRARR